MFRFISSFFGSSEPEESLEEIVAVLTQDTASSNCNGTEINFNSKDSNIFLKNECNYSQKVGYITAKHEGVYIIDNLYTFPQENEEFQVESCVSYYKHVTNGEITIYNVNHVNDWDIPEEKSCLISTRVMVGKIEQRIKRILILSPGDIRIDLNKVSIEFIPIIGDWVEIEVKYEVNEQALDLSGEVIEVLNVSPISAHIETGKVVFWDSEKQFGNINRKIYFNKESLCCGYIPVVGDQVVCEIIESEQGSLTWRALKVLPESSHKGNQGFLKTNLTEFKENHPGLEISECNNLKFNKLGEMQQFTITITNNNSEELELISIEIPTNNSQLYFTDDDGDVVYRNLIISSGEHKEIKMSCHSKLMGNSNEFIQFNFKQFSIGKYIHIAVNSDKIQNDDRYQRNSNVNYNNCFAKSENLIRGPTCKTARFQTVRLPDYAVPKNLLTLIVKYANQNEDELIEHLQVLKKSLFTNLNPVNYEDRFHTLTHLDEIANIIHIRQYDQELACFIPNGEFLMLEIVNLAERRPSIVLGDKILARDPSGKINEEYEGNVFRVGAKHVYLKFSSIFHNIYRGEDYSIRVIPGRASYRRQHHAIYLVARNLGKDWLFPTKIIEKKPQIYFSYDSYPRNKFANEIDNIKSELLDHDGDKITNLNGLRKIEWLNNQLNCKQKDAVINILKGISRPLPFIIFGPPGTGKTVTVIESILQIIRLIPGVRVLVTAPSNSAADLIALRLIDSGILKPGHLVRFVSINYAVGSNIPVKLMPYCATGSMARDSTADQNILHENGMTYDCSRLVLGRHKITVSTCSSAGNLHQMGFPKGHFTHIFIDEAGQASEPEIMIPASFVDKDKGQIILAGDPLQLGPVVLCKIAKNCGLADSFLERLINRFPYARDIQGFPDTEGYDPRIVTKLLHNYRSLDSILKLFSFMFYHDELIPTISNETSAESKTLQELSSILPKKIRGQTPAVVFHAVEGENFQTADSPSWYNPDEAAQVFYYMNEFLRLGIKSPKIGIITPYAKQVRVIREVLKEAEFDLPKVGTVEDFQGQEFDIIIISTVRSSAEILSNDTKFSLGFVASPRRLNVAISRAKSLLLIIGNPFLLSNDSYWKNVINYAMEHGAYTGCDF